MLVASGTLSDDWTLPGLANKKREYALQLAPRKYGGCQTFFACQFCATPSEYPRLDMRIIGEEDFDGVSHMGRLVHRGRHNRLQCLVRM